MTDKLNALRLLYQQGELAAVLRQVQADQDYGKHSADLYSLAANAGLQLQAYRETVPLLVALQRLRPELPVISRNLSHCYNELGRTLAVESRMLAEDLYAKALQVWPENPSALFNLAECCRAAGRPAEAIRYLLKLLVLQSDDIECRASLAEIYCAEEEFDRAVRTLDPIPAEIWATVSDQALLYRYAQLYSALADTECARRIYARLRQSGHDSWKLACQSCLALCPIFDSVEHLAAERDRFRRGLGELSGASFKDLTASEAAWANFFLAYQGADDRSLLQNYGGILRRALMPIAGLRAPPERSRRLVAMVSSGFRDCTIGCYFGPWVAGLREHGFDILLLQLGPAADHITASLLAQAGRGRVCADVNELLSELQAATPDVVLYPELGIDHRLLPVAAQRLAPLQLLAWGHPQTSGLATIDYFVSCAAMEPAEAAAHYNEALLLLPGIGTQYLPVASDPPPAPDRDRFGLPNTAPLLLQPQSSFKLHVDNDALMAQILHRLPSAKLVMFKDSQRGWQWRLNQRLTRTFARYEVAFSERVIVLPQLSRADYLAVNACCNVMLDSRHFSGGNTALDALSVGLPIVTWPGEFMRGRQSMAMLQLLGLTELIADCEQSYIDKVVRICQQPGYRIELGASIIDRRQQLFNDPVPVAALAAHIAILGGDKPVEI